MDAIHRIVVEELRLVEDVRSIMPSEQETLNTPLLGKYSQLDSVKLIMLIFAIEHRVQDELGVSIQISSERAVSQSQSPFRNIRSLVKLTDELVKKRRERREDQAMRQSQYDLT